MKIRSAATAAALTVLTGLGIGATTAPAGAAGNDVVTLKTRLCDANDTYAGVFRYERISETGGRFVLYDRCADLKSVIAQWRWGSGRSHTKWLSAGRGSSVDWLVGDRRHLLIRVCVGDANTRRFGACSSWKDS